MYSIYLGIGSNMGDRLGNISRAVKEIDSIANVFVVSSIYETEPVDMIAGDLFYNMALGIYSKDDPPLLLVQLKKIEKKIGRKLHSHLEPRIIDIDILLYHGLAYEDNTVRVPHSKLEYRRFALEPLCEIAPTEVHPNKGKTIAFLLRNCRDQHRVIRTEYSLNLITTH